MVRTPPFAYDTTQKEESQGGDWLEPEKQVYAFFNQRVVFTNNPARE